MSRRAVQSCEAQLQRSCLASSRSLATPPSYVRDGHLGFPEGHPVAYGILPCNTWNAFFGLGSREVKAARGLGLDSFDESCIRSACPCHWKPGRSGIIRFT